ncbi:MAG TPA: sodium/solute symporter [Thermoguttaceae bacterium]|nr:sodium/solute symporter [Thermoguttaceae bacterium]
MQTLQTLDYVSIAVYMALMAGIGLLLGGLVKDVGAYFKAGGTLPWVAAAISNYMSMFSAFIFVAYAGIAYQDGLVAITVVWCTVPPALLGAALFGPRWRRAGIMTPVEYLETRFNAPVRQFFSWGGIGFGVLNNMVRLYAIGIFISGATPLSLEVSILVAGVIVVLYTFLGGLWAVVLTDTVQFVVLIFTTLILLPLALNAVGGLGGLREALPDHFSFFRGPKGAPLYLLAYYTMISIKYNGNWSFIQRFYSVRDEAAGRKMGLLMAALFLVFPFFFLLPAMAARVVVPDLADPQTAYAAIALRLLPPGIMGLMMAAMFAATMSAVDSELNVTAGVFVRDVYERHLRPAASPGELMWVARGTTLVVGGLIVAGAMFVSHIGGAFEANKLLTALIGIPLAIPLVMGIVLRPPRPWGAIAAVLVGVAAGVVLNLHPEVSWPWATLTVIGLTLATLLVSGLIPSRDAGYRQRVDDLFARLATPVADDEKPVPEPGFRRALTVLLAVALAAAGALFVAMSLPSLGELSGMLALTAGLVCCSLALFVFRNAHGPAETPGHTLS